MLVRLPSSQYSVNPNHPHIIKVNLTSLALEKLHKPNWVNRVYAIPKLGEILRCFGKNAPSSYMRGGPHTWVPQWSPYLMWEEGILLPEHVRIFPKLETFYYTCGTQRRNWVVYIVFLFCFSDMGFVGNERKFGFWKLIIIRCQRVVIEDLFLVSFCISLAIIRHNRLYGKKML